MENRKKAAVVLGLAAALGASIYLATKAEAAPERELKAKVGIEILDSQGNLVPHNSPAVLTEGESYTMVVTVTNMSTKAGTPWQAVLTIDVSAAVDGSNLMPPSVDYEPFAAGATENFSYPLSVPLGYGGFAGSAVAIVRDPLGATLDTAIESLTIVELPIVYGAGIVIGLQ